MPLSTSRAYPVAYPKTYRDGEGWRGWRMGTVSAASTRQIVCGLLGHSEIPLARVASNSVRATCVAFSVAAAPTGFAS